MAPRVQKRFLVTAALAGVLAAVFVLPPVLDSLYRFVARASGSRAEPAEMPNSDSLVFDRIVINDPGKSLAQRQEIAEELARNISAGLETFDSVSEEYSGGKAAPPVRISRVAAENSPDLRPLALLEPGKFLPSAVYDEKVKTFALFRLKEVEHRPSGGASPEQEPYNLDKGPVTMAALALLGVILGVALGQAFLRVSERFLSKWEATDTGDKVNFFLGAVLGLIGSLPFMLAVGNLGQPWSSLITLAIAIGLASLGVFALRSMGDVLPWQSGGPRAKKSGIKVIDTNVLIDGRLYDLARTGFIDGEFYVANFVLRELQFIADSSDSLRRQRGRRGLDMLRHLQSDFPVKVGEHDRFAGDQKDPVDERLVRLAKSLGADLVSNDYNLNRVASIQNVRVLNINDLALAVRPNVLPGETLELLIVREGNQAGQGIGYLDDGTMVVIPGAREYIGETRPVWVSQVIQTERGKMIFAEIDNPEGEVEQSDPKRKPQGRPGKPL